MTDLKIRRGTQTQLPALTLGEPGFTTDTKRLYVGDGIGNNLIGPTADTLLELTDTPSTYDNGKYLQSTTAGAIWAAVTGIQGPKGEDGGEWICGYGAPPTASGSLNNFYLDLDTGDIYKKESSAPLQYKVMIEREADYSYTFADAVRFVKAGQEVIVDNLDDEASFTGTWNLYNTSNAWAGGCRYATSSYGAQATFMFTVPENGEYDIYAYWPVLGSAARNVPFEITHVSGTNTVRKDQHTGTPQWNYLATYTFDGAATWVWKMNIKGTDGSTTFSGLSDTPSGYEVGKYLKSTSTGTEWYNITDDHYTESEVDTISGSLQSKIDTHTSDIANPHSVTLEQARVAGNTISSNNRIQFRDINNTVYSNAVNELTVHAGNQINIDRDLVIGRNLTISTGVTVNTVRDEDDFGHDDAGALVTQQSAKAYVDNLIVASGTVTHNNLANLDYASAGHIGFVSTATAQSISGAKTFTSDVDLDDNNLNNVERISFEQRSVDVATPDDGDVWYRNDTENIIVRANTLTHESQLVKIVECYNTVAVNVNVTTPVAISFGAEDFKDDLYTHSTITNNSRVEVERNGIYEISYAICIDDTTNSRKTIRSRIRVNGTTYQRRGTSYSYSRNATDDKQANTVIFPISLSANNYVEVMCDRQGSSGTANTIVNESFIYIKLIRYV